MRRVLVIEADETARRELMLGLRERAIDADAVPDADGPAAALVLGQAETGAIVLGSGSSGALATILRAAAAGDDGGGAGRDGDGRRASNGPAGGGAVAVLAIVDDVAAGWDAMRAGAADFIVRPAALDAVALALRKADARRACARAQGAGAGAAAASGAGDGHGVAAGGAPDPENTIARFIGANAGVAALLAKVRRFAPVPSTVLIGGESGTGKELIARALHDLSPWRRGAFVPVNCGAIPAGLIESELFGHARGAFTDAVRDKRGLFEVADGGTLFLDEIADLPLGLQAKLLRVLQDGMIRRVGATDDVRVHVRVLAATARDLAEEVRAGRFREDFYYRLAGLELQIPALRARREDIPRLAEHFLRQACERMGLPARDIDPEALRLLVSYSWPGNVRELENTIERAAVLCGDNRVDVASLPDKVVAAVAAADAAAVAAIAAGSPGTTVPSPEGVTVVGPGLSIKRATLEIEEILIRRALFKTHGNRVRAAELLEISHRALLYKIKDYAIEVDSAKRGAGSKTADAAEGTSARPKARPAG